MSCDSAISEIIVVGLGVRVNPSGLIVFACRAGGNQRRDSDSATE